MGRITVSRPKVIAPLEVLNAGKSYPEQIKPFNFILSCRVAKLGHPIGVDPKHFHLIAPYETDPRRWDKLQWIDQYSGKRYRITALGPHGSRTVARVKSYGDALREYEYHPEAKYADSNGTPCLKQTVGLLGRRHIAIDLIKYIGKESNNLEDVGEQSVPDPRDVYTEYRYPLRDEWVTKILPMLKAMPLRELMEISGMSRAQLQRIRAGRRPRRDNRATLTKIAITTRENWRE